MSGVLELYDQLKNGEDINWGVVLTKTFGGALKGVILSIPGANVLATGTAIGTIGTVENYLSSLLRGDNSLNSLNQSIAGGCLEGISAGALKWLGNKLTRNLPKNKGIDKKIEINLKELSEKELENIYGKGNFDYSALDKFRFEEFDKLSKTIKAPAGSPNVKYAGKSVVKRIELESGEIKDIKVKIDNNGFPDFSDYSKCKVNIHEKGLSRFGRQKHQRDATKILRNKINSSEINKNIFNEEQLNSIQKGKYKIPGYTWHHNQEYGVMELIPENIHKTIKHKGGYWAWGEIDKKIQGN